MEQFVMSIWQRLPDMPAELWAVLSEMAPYLLLGFFIAGLLSVLVSPAVIERHLGGRGIWPVIKAAAVGVPLPLCSCGVIPVSASLRRHGATRGATTSFLISTPETGVDSIAVTYSLLGGVFAVVRVVVALLSGILGGFLVDLADRHKAAAPGQQLPPAPADCADACCAKTSGGRLRRAIAYGFSTLPRDLARSLIVGLLIAALISVLVPKDFFATSFGGVLSGGIIGMLIMMAMGIPIYVCATASVPMAWALIDRGVSPGAAFAFLVTGPATNAATIAMVWKVMGRRTAVIYLLTVAAGAMAGGLFLDYVLASGVALGGMEATHHHMQDGSAMMALKSVCAVALLVVLAVAIIRGQVSSEASAQEGVEDKGFDLARITIGGMTCGHCAAAVGRALRETPGVENATVDLDRAIATAGGEALDEQALRQAVESLGYVVKDIVIKTADPIGPAAHKEK